MTMGFFSMVGVRFSGPIISCCTGIE